MLFFLVSSVPLSICAISTIECEKHNYIKGKDTKINLRLTIRHSQNFTESNYNLANLMTNFDIKIARSMCDINKYRM